jgi:hypothetical protein
MNTGRIAYNLSLINVRCMNGERIKTSIALPDTRLYKNLLLFMIHERKWLALLNCVDERFERENDRAG